MNNLTVISAIESALVNNDLSKLNSTERVTFVNKICESLGLNPLTKPFSFINLSGKLTLYATRDATDQLRKLHGISITIKSRERIEGLYVVTALAKEPGGREDESTGVVPVEGLKAADLANAFLKCETKAKRRATLSICGLGFIDETEVSDISRDVKTADFDNDPFEKNIEAIPEVMGASNQIGDYIATFGKYKNQKLSDLDAFELDGYVGYIRRKASEDNRPIQGQVLEFVQAAEAFLSSIEVQQK